MLHQVNVRDPALALKATPPRATKAFLERNRFSFDRVVSSGAPVISLCAPAGFGKTAQLVQWRRQALALGSLTFWLTADERDEPLRFVQGLAYAARELAGKRGFNNSFMEWLDATHDPMLALTGWLAEVASLAVDVLLTIDDVERLPASTRAESLIYLLANAPANLVVALGTRPSAALPELGGLNKMRVTQLTASELRFSLEETSDLVSRVLRGRFTPDLAIRLHELTDGWPLGIQMAVSALNSTSDPADLLSTVAKDIRQYFIDKLIDQQPVSTRQMLVQMADFEVIHPELCRQALGPEAPLHELNRLIDESPLFIQSEGSEWMKFHPIAREALRERLATQDPAQRLAVSKSAGTWYAEHRLFQEAANILRSAGDKQGSLKMAEHCMREMIMHGRNAAVIEWIKGLDRQDIEHRADFLVPAAWAFAMSDCPSDAQPMLDLLLAQPQLSTQDQFEVDLIKAAIAAYTDDFELQSHVLEAWSEPPPSARPQSIPIYWVAKAFQALSFGKPDLARLQFAKVARLDRSLAYSPSAYGFVDNGIALTHLWEGRYTLAEQTLRPALTRAEERMGRRSPIACMLGALLAHVCWEQGKSDEAQALLALRLDLIERYGLPDALIAAHCTLAAIALAEQKQDQGLSFLDALFALGDSRGVIRIKSIALLEQVKLHLKFGRISTAQKLSDDLVLLVASQNKSKSANTTASAMLQLHAKLSIAYMGLAEKDAGREHSALEAPQTAISIADKLKRGAEGIQARVLRAQTLERLNHPEARAAMIEAISLAKASGMTNLLTGLNQSGDAPTATPHTASTQPTLSNEKTNAPDVAGSALLTGKERDILLGLVKNLSNKEIALASGVSEQTIKWHMKNLFSKLNAGNRKHAVARAQLLGLLIKA